MYVRITSILYAKISAHGGVPIDPDKRDETQGAPSIAATKNFISSHFKGVDASSPYIVEHCIFTQTPDEDFIIDKHPNYTNIVIGAGFSGMIFMVLLIKNIATIIIMIRISFNYDN